MVLRAPTTLKADHVSGISAQNGPLAEFASHGATEVLKSIDLSTTRFDRNLRKTARDMVDTLKGRGFRRAGPLVDETLAGQLAIDRWPALAKNRERDDWRGADEIIRDSNDRWLQGRRFSPRERIEIVLNLLHVGQIDDAQKFFKALRLADKVIVTNHCIHQAQNGQISVSTFMIIMGMMFESADQELNPAQAQELRSAIMAKSKNIHWLIADAFVADDTQERYVIHESGDNLFVLAVLGEENFPEQTTHDYDLPRFLIREVGDGQIQIYENRRGNLYQKNNSFQSKPSRSDSYAKNSFFELIQFCGQYYLIDANGLGTTVPEKPNAVSFDGRVQYYIDGDKDNPRLVAAYDLDGIPVPFDENSSGDVFYEGYLYRISQNGSLQIAKEGAIVKNSNGRLLCYVGGKMILVPSRPNAEVYHDHWNPAGRGYDYYYFDVKTGQLLAQHKSQYVDPIFSIERTPSGQALGPGTLEVWLSYPGESIGGHKFQFYRQSDGTYKSRDWERLLLETKSVDTNDLEILGLAAEPKSLFELKQAYKRMSRIVHPDMPGGSREAFIELKAAYQRVLTKNGWA